MGAYDDDKSRILAAGERGEELVYEFLAPLENEGYHILRNVCHLTLESKKKEGECDIVLMGPLGFLVLEVKAGQSIQQDQTGYFDNNSNKRFNPFTQAAEGANWFNELVLEHFGTRRVNRGYGAVFTRSRGLTSLNPPTNDWLQLCLDAVDIGKGGPFFRARILELCAKWDRSPSGSPRLTKNDWLDFANSRMNFAVKLEEIRNDAQHLQSMRAFRRMGRISKAGPAIIAAAPLQRVLFLGGPGTGKTLALIEIAKRNKGLIGICVCYNVLLSDHIRREFKALGLAIPVIDIRGLEFMMLNHSPRLEELQRLEKEAKTQEEKTRFYHEELPNAVLELIKPEMHGICDFIIVDEAQDLQLEAWWKIISSFHREPDKGSWYIAADMKQVIHKPNGLAQQLFLTHFPKDLPIWPLKWNYRNAPPICKLVNRNKTWEDMLSALEDHDDEYLKKGVRSIDHKDLNGALTNCIKTLKSYSLTSADIVVISCRTYKNSILAKKQEGKVLKYAGLTIDGTEKGTETNIPYFTIHRFKGLEAKVVILCDFKDKHKAKDEQHDNLYRIAMSRAQLMVFEIE